MPEACVGRARQLSSRAFPLAGQKPALLHHCAHTAGVHVIPPTDADDWSGRNLAGRGSPFKPCTVITVPAGRDFDGVRDTVMVLTPHCVLDDSAIECTTSMRTSLVHMVWRSDSFSEISASYLLHCCIIGEYTLTMSDQHEHSHSFTRISWQAVQSGSECSASSRLSCSVLVVSIIQSGLLASSRQRFLPSASWYTSHSMSMAFAVFGLSLRLAMNLPHAFRNCRALRVHRNTLSIPM